MRNKPSFHSLKAITHTQSLLARVLEECPGMKNRSFWTSQSWIKIPYSNPRQFVQLFTHFKNILLPTFFLVFTWKAQLLERFTSIYLSGPHFLKRVKIFLVALHNGKWREVKSHERLVTLQVIVDSEWIVKDRLRHIC